MRKTMLLIITSILVLSGLLMTDINAEPSLSIRDVSYEDGSLHFEGIAGDSFLINAYVRSEGTIVSSYMDIDVIDGVFIETVWLGDLDPGTYRLYVSCNLASTYAEFTVSKAIPVRGLSLDRDSITLSAGETTTLIATTDPADAGAIVVWHSENPLVAEVDSKGSVTPIAYGRTTIVASVGNMSAECDVVVEYAELEVSSKVVTIPKGDTSTITVSLPDGVENVIKTDPDSSIAEASYSDGNVVIKGKGVGSTSFRLTAGMLYSVEIKVLVVDPSISQEKSFSFFIQITKDFDEVSYGGYSESDLRSGITISAKGYNAADALMKACSEKGIDCSMNNDPKDTYYGWILSLFGLKQYQTPGDTSVWTYWVQYHNGSYNQWTLGHYTDGGSFRLIWKSTDESGSDVVTPSDKPSSETTKNPDGSTTTTTTTTEKDDSGNTTEKVESTTTNKDGSTSSTVTETMKDASGNITSVTESTSTTSKGDDGSKVTETTSTTTTSSGVISESSKVTEKETEDGSEVRTESTSTVKDASGNVKETKETITEVITTSDSVTEITSTETVRNGVTERTESAVFDYGDGAITSKVENTIGSDGKAKSTSVTTIDVSDGQLTADQAKIAVDGTEGAIDRLPTTPASVEKVVEVRSSDASVSVDPKALETLSGFGSGLRIVGDEGSIHVDGDVCNSLSGKPSAVTFSMNADAKDSLNDKQKQVVGDSRFIDLSAKVGDERIHQLGGTATVTFGYTPSATDDVSRLCVYYVDENGDRFMVTSSFDRDTGTFTIEVDHFSIFMVGMAEESADGGFPTSAVAIVIVVAILAVVGAVVYHSRRS